MPEWIGSLLFLFAVGLSGAKLARDFGERGLRGYAMLFVLIFLYGSAVAIAWA